MITLLMGENSFEVDRILGNLIAKFDGTAEKFDGAELRVDQLPDILMGLTLFAERRLVVIKRLSENSEVWSTLGEWLEKTSDTIDVVLAEGSLDKRTKTYKWLQKHASVKECQEWTSRDQPLAVEWVRKEAERKGFTLTSKLAGYLVDRVGVAQWRLAAALDKLALASGAISETIINDVSEPQYESRVFELFVAAVSGKTDVVREIIVALQRDEDPYRVFGLLASQALQFAALCSGDKSSREVAGDTGAHPFALSQLAGASRGYTAEAAFRIVRKFAQTDRAMKTTSTSSWLLIEKLLLEIATS